MVFTVSKKIAVWFRAVCGAGFTLIELTVSVGVIALTAALFIANYHSTTRQTDLTMTAQKMVADLRAAQNNSLGLVEYNGAVPAGGWGVHFDTTQRSYTMFADLNAPGTSGYMQYDPPTEGRPDYGARETDFSPDIKIAGLSGSSGAGNQANVSFLPPDPQTNILVDITTSTSLQIVLKSLNTATCRNVSVNFLGLIEASDAYSCP